MTAPPLLQAADAAGGVAGSARNFRRLVADAKNPAYRFMTLHGHKSLTWRDACRPSAYSEDRLRMFRITVYQAS
jgi:hypothetical protein